MSDEALKFDTSEEDFTEQLRADGQAYFAAAHPNPQRQGCPLTSRLNAAVRSNQPPEEELLAHLFACSECFGQYRRQMAARSTPVKRALREDAPAAVRRAGPLRRQLFAVVAGLVVVCGLFAVVWQNRSRPRPDELVSVNQPDLLERGGVHRPGANPSSATEPAEITLAALLKAAQSGESLALRFDGATRLKVTFDASDSQASAAARSLTHNAQPARVIASEQTGVLLEFGTAPPFKAGDRLCFTYDAQNQCVRLQVATQ